MCKMLKTKYPKYRNNARSLLYFLIFLFVALSVLQLGFNTTIDPESWIFSLESNVQGMILKEIRFPCWLITVLTGSGFSIIGLTFQTLFKNPLVESGVLGLNTVAALSFVMAVYAGVDNQLALCSISIMSVLFLSLLYIKKGYKINTNRLILLGVAVTALSSAVLTFVLYTAYSDYPLHHVVNWLYGSFENAERETLTLVVPFFLLGFLLFLKQRKNYNALLLGSTVAHSMGVAVSQCLNKSLFAAAFIVGALTPVTGVLGFVGLIVPSLVRLKTGSLIEHTFWPCVFGGAVLTMFARSLTNIMPLTHTLPVGCFLAILGAPILLYLLVRTNYHAQP